MKKTPCRCLLQGVLVGAIISAAASGSLHAQQYWDQNSVSPSIDLENGTFSADQEGLDTTTYSNSLFAGDLIFSSDLVTSPAQTILLDDNEAAGQYAADGIEFASGSITLEDDPNAKGSALFIGDDGITMDAGSGAASISPALLYVDDAESWNNNSSASLTVGGALETAYGNSALSFYGQGTGSVNITGAISSGISIDQESATSTLYLTNTSNSGMTGLNINGGTVVATNLGSIGGGNLFPITIEHGGTLAFQNSITMTTTPVLITNGGTLDFAGDTLLEWTQGVITADTLTLGSGDALDLGSYNQTTNSWVGESQNIGTLDLVQENGAFSRLIVGINGQGYALLDGIQQINVGTGYILDFGGNYSNNPVKFNATVSNPINVANGGAIESRNNGTTTLTDVTLPLTGTFVFGTDDDGQGGSIVIASNYTLPGTFTVAANGSGENGVFSGNFSGAGGITLTGADANSYNPYAPSAIWLKGTNTYQGSTDVVVSLIEFPATQSAGVYDYVSNTPALYIAGNNSGTGNDYEVQGGDLIVDPAGKLPTTAVVSLNGIFNDPNNNQAYIGGISNFIIGDGNGSATATIAGLKTGGPISNQNIQGSWVGAFVGNGWGGGGSTLVLDPVAGQTFEFDSQIGDGRTIIPNVVDIGVGNWDTYAQYGAGGSFFNNLQLVKTGAGTQFITDQQNDYSGGTVINGGTILIPGGNELVWDTNAQQAEYNVVPDATHVVVASYLGTGPITLNYGGELAFSNYLGFWQQVNLGTAGPVTYGDDTWQAAGTLGGTGDYYIQGYVSGGTGLVVGGGDLLANTNYVGSPGTIYVVGGRLLMFNNTNFIDGATSVITADGGILDFGTGDNTKTTETVPIYFSDGGAIEDRGTDEVLTNVQPLVGSSGTMPTLTIGTDDGGGGSITITNSVNLTNSAGGVEILGVFSDNRSFTLSNFAGGFSGTGNLNYDTAALAYNYITTDRGLVLVGGPNTYKGDTIIKGGELDLTGSSAGVTSATGGAPNYFVSTSTKTYTDSNNNVQSVQTAGILQVGAGGSLATDANIILGGSTAGTQGYLAIGDLFGAANLTVGSITANAGGGAIFNGDYANRTMETLTVNVAANTTDTFTGTIGSDPYNYNFGETAEGYNQLNNANQLSLVKSGSGTLSLNGTNNYAGTTTVNGGKLNINSVLNSGVTVNAGGAIGGSGFIKGTISGAGAVTLGDPTVLVANAVDPSSGMSFNFEFSLTGEPNYGSAGSSGNDVLHLESGSPFAAAFTAANVFNIYLAGNGTFDGGIFVNGGDALTANNIAGATYNYYVLNNIGGNVTYDGNRYSLASAIGGTVTASTFQALNAGFDDGTTSGYEQQFVVSGAVIPEPSTYALMAVAGLMFLFVRRRIKA